MKKISAEALQLAAEAHEEFVENMVEGVQLDLTDTDVRGVDFSRSYLQNAIFRGADCRGCNFRGAWLSNTDFVGANLKGALFLGASVSTSVFSEKQLKEMRV